MPKTQRAMSNNAIAASFTEKLSDIPGATIKVTPVSEINLGGQSSPINFSLQGKENDVLQELTPRITSAMARVPGLVNIDASARPGKPELTFRTGTESASRRTG